jgi:hypothetical protein
LYFLAPHHFIPAMLTANSVQKKAEEIEERANQEIEALAREYFDQTVVPFCKKYDLEFSHGMGMLAFIYSKYERALYIHDADQIPDAEECGELDEDDLFPSEKFALEFPGAKKEMEEIFAVINIVAFRFEIGFSMPCYLTT